jgi:hypothetical protein
MLVICVFNDDFVSDVSLVVGFYYYTHSVALQPWRAQAAVNTVP